MSKIGNSSRFPKINHSKSELAVKISNQIENI
jgi:hypothetical protein